MNCPHCNVALERKVVRGRTTEIDRCPKCGGIWFDDGEVAALLGSRERAAVPPDARVDPRLQCPKCRVPLSIFGYPGTLTVAEGCRRCGGIWLDAGEFEEIRKSKASQPERRQPVPVPRQQRPRPPQSTPPMHQEIGGLKGSLIRFIDRSLSAMVDGIRKK